MKYHKDLSERNKQIREEFEQMREGSNLYNYQIIRELSDKYFLSIQTIEKIVYPLNKNKVKNK